MLPVAPRSARILCWRWQRFGTTAWASPKSEAQKRSFSASFVKDIRECKVNGKSITGENHLEFSSQITELMRPSFAEQTPLVLRNLLSATPRNVLALQNFSDWNHWENHVANEYNSPTICHIELGGNYSKSEIADVPFADFLSYLQLFENRFGRSPATNPEGPENLPESSDLMYLAQNDIFPRVLDEIDIPILSSDDLTQSTTDPLGVGSLYSTMLWIGAYGCVSPLHNDPLDNLLMQFVGTKKVFVCAPDSKVNAGSSGNQVNTSSLNPEIPEERQQSGVTFLQTTLYPGDALYIPKKWFHHIRTVETSISVNTWFR